MNRAIRSTCGLVIGAAVCTSSAAAAEFIGLGDLPGGSVSSSPVAISADGSVVVGNGTSAQGSEAFRWTRSDGMVGLAPMPGARDASGDGSVIIGNSGAGAFRWTQASGMVELPPPAGSSVLAERVSADGTIIVGRLNGMEVARWTQSTGWVGLGSVPGPGSPYDFPNAMSDDGSVVAGETLKPPVRPSAFRWTPSEGMRELGLPPGMIAASARGISNDGGVIGGGMRRSDGGEVPFKWTQSGGFVELPILGDAAHNHSVLDANFDGSILAGSSFGEAVIWDANGIRSVESILIEQGIDLTGWSLSAAVISADGTTLAGSGIHNGNQEAWVAVIIPEPTALVPLGVTIAPVLLRRSARSRS